MPNKPTSDIHALIDGEILDEAAIDRIEVQRARLALEYLRKQLGNDRLRDLLADDIALSSQRMKSWFAASDGNWSPIVTEVALNGINGAKFVAWWCQSWPSSQYLFT